MLQFNGNLPSVERVARVYPNQHLSTGRSTNLVQERLACVCASAVYGVEKAIQTVNQVLSRRVRGGGGGGGGYSNLSSFT